MGSRRAPVVAAGLVAALAVGAVHVASVGAVDQGDGSCLLHSRSGEAAQAQRRAVGVAAARQESLAAAVGEQAAGGRQESDELPSPRPVVPASESGLRLRLQRVGGLADPLNRSRSPERRAPVALGRAALLIPDQEVGVYKASYSRLTGRLSEPKLVLDLKHPPAGFELTTINTLQNVAPNERGDRVYVMLSVKSRPSTVPVRLLPPALPDVIGSFLNESFVQEVSDFYSLTDAPPLNFPGSEDPPFAPTEIAYLTLFEYKFSKSSGELVDPRPIVALQYQLSRATHQGGALTTLPGGKLLFATGDSLPFGVEGRFAPQSPEETPSKLLIIDPSTGGVEVVAVGVRNPQHFDLAQRPGPRKRKDFVVGFADIGGWTAEEVNFVSLKDLLDTRSIENFGWGRNPDGLAREGTFYVSEGLAFTFGTPAAVNRTPPVDEPGFRQPYAQYKREALGDPNGGVAVAGPVTSKKSFKTIAALFGDLLFGRVYATTERDLRETDQVVKQVLLLDASGTPLAEVPGFGPGESLNSFFGGERVDGRFFRLPDGFAAVLLERTGDIYRFVEV